MEAHDKTAADVKMMKNVRGMSREDMRNMIFAAKDIESQMVVIPEWGDIEIEMRTPTVARRGELLSEFIDGDKIDFKRMYPALVVATAFVPGTDEPLFTRDDMEALSQKSAKAMERLGKVATELSGMEDASERMEVGKESSTPILNSLTSTGFASDSSA